MSKGKDTKKKDTKTAPSSTPKEKKAAKALKKHNRNNAGNPFMLIDYTI